MVCNSYDKLEISIHALREESDLRRMKGETMAVKFQSTPSARRATHLGPVGVGSTRDFNPRPPRGERPGCVQCAAGGAPYFNPRPPRGGRLDIFLVVGLAKVISIHALREEGDPDPSSGGHMTEKISIHALREEGDRPRAG